MIRRLVSLLLFAGVLGGPLAASAQIPAFPGAEGFGAISVGGRAGDVYHVTSLDDTNTLGTLRHAISSAPAGGRIIVFDISGNIHLTSDLHVSNPKLTIAGQTAPGQGITLTGDSVWLEDDDLVVRYIRSRLTSTGGTQDSMSIQNGNRVIMDHCSASWSSDEVTSMTHNSTDNTIQWSLITEALNSANHSRASLFRPGADVGEPYSYNLTVHHSLYAHSADRNPVFSTYNDKTLYTDFRNNVVFDWKNQATHTGDVDSNIRVNFISNYYVVGLTTRADLVADPSIFSSGSTDTWVYYNDDNLVDATRDDGLHNGIWDPTAIGGARTVVTTPFDYPAVTTQSASDAYESVLELADSFWWNRDPVDNRVITDVHEISDPDPLVRAQAGTMLTTEADAGGLPILSVETRAADWDTDQDGMPSYWEVQHGLDPNTGGAAQYNGDFDSDGYTNIEEYINDVGAFPAVQPIVWDGTLDNRYAAIQNWDINWQPSRFDESQINTGTVVVDAVGQHAGKLVLGANPGDNATLNITRGWLKVEDTGVASASGDLIIGGGAGATGTLNVAGGCLDIGNRAVIGAGAGAVATVNVTGGWLKVADQVVIGADPGATAALSLSGGELTTPLLSKGAGGTFSFTGGKLHADEVEFDLVADGGTVAPGSSVGQTHVSGDLTIHTGAVEVEIGSASQFDTVSVDGTATLGGDLRPCMIADYIPESTDVFEVLTAGSLSGVFANAPDEVAVNEATFDVTYTSDSILLYNFTFVAPELPGDYNDDGVVDAADYTVWRDSFGGYSLPNEGTSLGIVDEYDFLIWKANFGMTAGSGSGSLAAVPEPTSLVTLLIGSVLTILVHLNTALCCRGSR